MKQFFYMFRFQYKNLYLKHNRGGNVYDMRSAL